MNLVSAAWIPASSRATRRGTAAACGLCFLAAIPPAHADPRLPAGIAGKLIDHYHMQRVPQEGPWFSLTYSGEDRIDGAALPPRYAGRTHVAGNAIVVVATPADFSALHRLQTDEVWHFYAGTPLDMLLLYPDGHGRRLTLGADVLAGQYRQFTVPHGVWQGAAPRGASAGTYSFAGTQLSPGFDYADFEMGYRSELQRAYPAYAKDIERLTRAEFATGPADRPAQPGPPASKAVAFSASDVPVLTVSPGVALQELVGRVARDAQSASVSVARFTLAPGRASAMSFNHHSEEVFLVTSGTGRVQLAEKVVPVGPGSTVFIPAGVRHSIAADANSTLVFHAVSAPAFTPDDYVLVKP